MPGWTRQDALLGSLWVGWAVAVLGWGGAAECLRAGYEQDSSTGF